MKLAPVLKKRARQLTRPVRNLWRNIITLPQLASSLRQEELASQRREARVLHVSRALPPV